LSARRYDLAIAHCQAALEVHPEQSSLLQILGWAYVYSGMYDKGAETIARSNAIDGIPPEMSPDLAYINAVTGKRTEARQTLRLLQTLGKDIDAGLLALISAGLGERRAALAMLEESYTRHSSMMTWLKVDARFDAIRQEAAFQDLMRRVGLI
jgi:Flp pilus assembly protein TadD